MLSIFDKSLGKWVSNRRYFYPNKKNEDIISHLTINKNIKNIKILDKEFSQYYSIQWVSNKNEGVMNIAIDDSFIYRDTSYLKDIPSKTSYSLIESNHIKMVTSYNNSIFEERILVYPDYRIRTTVALKKNKIYLIGEYLETKVDDF